MAVSLFQIRQVIAKYAFKKVRCWVLIPIFVKVKIFVSVIGFIKIYGTAL
jgi:hypothetical protein